MLRNAFAYVTRKWPKSLLLFAIILLMGTLSLIGLSMKAATQKASSESQVVRSGFHYLTQLPFPP